MIYAVICIQQSTLHNLSTSESILGHTFVVESDLLREKAFYKPHGVLALKPTRTFFIFKNIFRNTKQTQQTTKN